MSLILLWALSRKKCSSWDRLDVENLILQKSNFLSTLDFHKNIEIINGTYECCGRFGMHRYESMGIFGHASKLSKYYKSNLGKHFCELFVQDKINFDIK